MGIKGRETKNRIKNKAYLIFAQNGFKNVTMKDICDATELSRGGLYRHYNSTDQIFAEILEELSQKQLAIFQEKMKTQSTATKILEDTLNTLQEEMLDKKNSLSLAIYEFGSTNQSDCMEKLYQEAKYTWGELIQYGIKRNEFQPVNVEQVTDIILFSYQGIRMWSRVMQLEKETTEHIISHIRTLLLGE